VLDVAAELNVTPCGLVHSPLTGPAGNIEFLAWLQRGGPAMQQEAAIEAVLKD
jgi:23S rRNA (cytidine1920-2'-O)/16S rRNA (cytidine1409-2'-O)-methyltransferase